MVWDWWSLPVGTHTRRSGEKTKEVQANIAERAGKFFNEFKWLLYIGLGGVIVIQLLDILEDVMD